MKAVKMSTDPLSGYALISKGIFSHPVACKSPHFFKAWVYMICTANWKDNPRSGLKRGQLLTSFQTLVNLLAYEGEGGERVELSRGKIDHMLRWMKDPKQQMITTEQRGRAMVITVLEYDKWQNPDTYTDEPHNPLRLAHSNPRTNESENEVRAAHQNSSHETAPNAGPEQVLVREVGTRDTPNSRTKIDGNEVGTRDSISKEESIISTKSTTGTIDPERSVVAKDAKQVKLDQWMKTHYPYVAKMEKPLTVAQWEYLLAGRFKDRLDALKVLLLKMNNYKPLLKKNRDTFATILNWDQMQEDRESKVRQPKK